jgi:hypothetical protein
LSVSVSLISGELRLRVRVEQVMHR